MSINSSKMDFYQSEYERLKKENELAISKARQGLAEANVLARAIESTNATLVKSISGLSESDLIDKSILNMIINLTLEDLIPQENGLITDDDLTFEGSLDLATGSKNVCDIISDELDRVVKTVATKKEDLESIIEAFLNKAGDTPKIGGAPSGGFVGLL